MGASLLVLAKSIYYYDEISHLAFKVARLDFLGGIPPKFKHYDCVQERTRQA